MLRTVIAQTKSGCEESLRQPDMLEVAHAVERAGTSVDACVAMVHALAEAAESKEPVRALKSSVARFGISEQDETLERFLVLTTAVRSLDKLDALPVKDNIKLLFCEEFMLFAQPDEATKVRLHVEHDGFAARSKFASLRRFPAGAMDWEISGLPRSYFARIAPASLPRAAYFVAMKMGGFAPALFPHVGAHPKKSRLLVEKEVDKSFYRMAQTIELQPEMKGLVASSWLHSPDTHRVSPHLAWLNKTFQNNGAFICVMGAASVDSGVFHRSPERRKLYDAGQFKPTTGLILWPRRNMIEWAAQHPELAD